MMSLRSRAVADLQPTSQSGCALALFDVVSPGRVRESLLGSGVDPSAGIFVIDVARAYVTAIEGHGSGQTIVTSSSG